MANVTEDSLRRALVELGLTQTGLPKMWRGEQDGFWIKAVALVRKLNGDRSYYAVERMADGRIVYRTDFGRMSPVMELVRVFPYVFLDEARYVDVGDAGDRRFLLLSEAGDEEGRAAVRGMSDDEVTVRLRERGIALQLSDGGCCPEGREDCDGVPDCAADADAVADAVADMTAELPFEPYEDDAVVAEAESAVAEKKKTTLKMRC